MLIPCHGPVRRPGIRLWIRGGTLALALLTGEAASGRTLVPLPPMDSPRAGDRVLVVAPHPDDETLCCAGYLQQAVRAGATVGVVWITAGDSFEIDAIVTERTLRPKGAGLEKLGQRRIAEAHAAADLLGVPRNQQYMLGFPDRDIRALLRDPRSVPHRSHYTGVSAVPYADALHPGTDYTGTNLRRNLQEVFTRFAPTVVLAAAPQDRHSDHSASGALALALAHASAARPRVYYWIVHGGHKWPAPRGLHTGLSLRPPAAAAALAWRQLPLEEAQLAGKLTALRAHHTQLEVMSRFLNAFIRSNEIYAPPP
jgi:LmbE family N-acetylglucosaminyl deacetylase